MTSRSSKLPEPSNASSRVAIPRSFNNRRALSAIFWSFLRILEGGVRRGRILLSFSRLLEGEAPWGRIRSSRGSPQSKRYQSVAPSKSFSYLTTSSTCFSIEAAIFQSPHPNTSPSLILQHPRTTSCLVAFIGVGELQTELLACDARLVAMNIFRDSLCRAA